MGINAAQIEALADDGRILLRQTVVLQQTPPEGFRLIRIDAHEVLQNCYAAIPLRAQAARGRRCRRRPCLPPSKSERAHLPGALAGLGQQEGEIGASRDIAGAQLDEFGDQLGPDGKPPTPTCLPNLRHAAIVRA